METHADVMGMEQPITFADIMASYRSPHEQYRKLRQVAPAVFDGQRWLVTGYQVCVRLLQDARAVAFPPDAHSRSRASSAGLTPRLLLAQQMLFFPPAVHAQASHLIRRALLQQQRAPVTRQTIAQEVKRLLDQALQRGTMDVVRDFARPLSSLVAACVVGLPWVDRDRVLQWASWSDTFADYTSGYTAVSSEPIYRFQHDLFALIAAARAQPRTPKTVLDVLLASPDLFPSDQVIASNLQMVFAASRVTVEKTIAEGLYWLAHNPDPWSRIRAASREQPQAGARLAEEWLRVVTPTRYVKRWLQREIDGAEVGLGGVLMRRGQEVVLFLEAADRDPDMFADPHVCYPDRRPNPHLAFSAGAHLCPGAGLARLELGLVLEQVLGQVDALVPLEGASEDYAPNPNLGGLRAFSVHLHPALQPHAKEALL